ncbi:hypothetical protein Pla175_17320 [Pirellulimonas nuda]|uniref:Outer membrane lipoprotein-sorting protein n=1 Tax=Pirellulimonas nuda TaxID=2528009 RepID=A0A518DA44_9BACT|nr:DUF1571 domain-containing protein [Pirellulimonas nuda]QDU88357.1 hypothetical protein Pla175_17320 [Pirellulimonas nuda]
MRRSSLLMMACLLVALYCAPWASGQVVPATAESPLRPDGGAQEHPLTPVLALAERGLAELRENVRDYTCTVIRRERIGGDLRPYEFIDAKVREPRTGPDGAVLTPKSVYVNFLKPESLAGREALFVEGRDSNKMLVRRGGTRMAYVTTYLDPEAPIAMEVNRYPITEIGFARLVERLIEVCREDLKHDEVEVRYFDGAKIGDRVCTRITVEHPVPRDYFRYHRAVIFLDDERGLPLGYAAYNWPQTPDGKPMLTEEYIYTDVKLNVGLTDGDFDADNPAYGFIRRDTVVDAD